MKLAAIVVLVPFVALARTVTVSSLPPSEYADTEVSTNIAFTVERPAMTRIEFTVALDATPTNSVEVAIGSDANGDGNLSVEEAAYTFGFDCGKWFEREWERGTEDREQGLPAPVGESAGGTVPIGETHSDCAEMTCIEISTCVHCDWIPWKERKELGVGEKAIVIVEPDDVELGLSVQGCVSEYEQWIYRAPFRQEVDTVGVSCAGVTLQLRFVVEEPEIVLAVECYTNVTIGVGRAGGMSCDFDLRFMPTNVSFSAIETAELPRISTDATGYFAKSDLSYLLDHGQHGGGIWHGLLSGNRFFDRASVSELPREWNGGGSFTYPIPRAWRPSGVESDVHEVEHRSGYDQRMELDGDGTSRIIKFGYIVERMTNGVMTLTRSL